jgi:hypothetical protein
MYENNHLGKKISKKKGKKNKNLPPTSQPKLLRSIQMRSYCAYNPGVCDDQFASVIGITNPELLPPSPLYMTLEEL